MSQQLAYVMHDICIQSILHVLARQTCGVTEQASVIWHHFEACPALPCCCVAVRAFVWSPSLPPTWGQVFEDRW